MAGQREVPGSFLFQGKEKSRGAFYFKQDHTMGKLVIKEDLGEVVFYFANIRLADCVTNGATKFMIVFSLHGSGFGGFGGDDHTVGRRFLVLSNPSIVEALHSALDAHLGSESKFDVIRFDACLM